MCFGIEIFGNWSLQLWNPPLIMYHFIISFDSGCVTSCYHIMSVLRRPIESRIIHALGKTWHPEVISKLVCCQGYVHVCVYICVCVCVCSTLCVLTVRSHLRDADILKRKDRPTVRGITKW